MHCKGRTSIGLLGLIRMFALWFDAWQEKSGKHSLDESLVGCEAAKTNSSITIGKGKESMKILMGDVAGFLQDGSSIVSGWSDGKIRAFGPQSGKLLFTIHDAHHQGVTAIKGLGDSRHIVSGGGEGLVRLWAIHPSSQTMVASMKEHKVGPICSFRQTASLLANSTRQANQEAGRQDGAIMNDSESCDMSCAF